jgi:hypothetical protein
MARAGHDYVAAKAFYIRGLNLKQISDKMSIPYDALFKFCKRNGWDMERTKNTQLLSTHVQQQLAEQAGKHLMRITGLADKVVDSLLCKDVQTMKLQELETLGRIADTFDKINRRSYGMDSENGKTTLNVAVQVSPPSTTKPLCAIIDVEPENGAAQAQVTDGK